MWQINIIHWFSYWIEVSSADGANCALEIQHRHDSSKQCHTHSKFVYAINDPRSGQVWRKNKWPSLLIDLTKRSWMYCSWKYNGYFSTLLRKQSLGGALTSCFCHQARSFTLSLNLRRDKSDASCQWWKVHYSLPVRYDRSNKLITKHS